VREAVRCPPETGIRGLRLEVCLELGSRDRQPRVAEIVQEARDDALWIDRSPFLREPQVEEITSLSPLVERPELRPQELVERVGRDRCSAREPPGTDGEVALLDAEDAEGLQRVDLDLEAHGN